MLHEKSFFAAVAIKGSKIYTLGGYENIEKVQLKTCEIYDVDEDKWSANEGVHLNVSRSQCSACQFDENVIFVFGGYNKELGTLNSIERYDIE
jgi:N-acetylneuraminic acid mutarotase